jgi:hypothetical protein
LLPFEGVGFSNPRQETLGQGRRSKASFVRAAWPAGAGLASMIRPVRILSSVLLGLLAAVMSLWLLTSFMSPDDTIANSRAIQVQFIDAAKIVDAFKSTHTGCRPKMNFSSRYTEARISRKTIP